MYTYLELLWTDENGLGRQTWIANNAAHAEDMKAKWKPRAGVTPIRWTYIETEEPLFPDDPRVS